MKTNIYLKILFSTVLIFFVTNVLFAIQTNGYLITKNEKVITGRIVSISYTDYKSEVLFINDFGDTYRISPYLIKGFAYMKNGETLRYESKFIDNYWLFLKIELPGSGIRLYHSESAQYVKGIDGVSEIAQHNSVKTYWLELEGSTPFKIYKLGFRPKMRATLSQYPELAAKIGEKGYRYKDLKSIVKEYNLWWDATRLML